MVSFLFFLKCLLPTEKYIFSKKQFRHFSMYPYMDTFGYKKTAKTATFSCSSCEFNCRNKYNFSKHLLTLKHTKTQEMIHLDTNGYIENAKNVYTCECGKVYKYSQGLSKHKGICQVIISENTNNIVNIVKQNQEFKDLLLEQHHLLVQQNKDNKELQKQIIELTKEGKIINNTNTTNSNNNTTNNKFNLQFFLNEQCKDAMNIMDFVKSLTLQLADLERVGQIGYAEGISKVFVKGLKDLDVFKRPIHCSDLKREVLYVKDKDAWEKENDENAKIKLAIKHIAHKNVQQIPEWQQENPEYSDSQSIISEKYMKIVSHSMGGFTDAEDDTNYNKIIKNVAKEVVIEK